MKSDARDGDSVAGNGGVAEDDSVPEVMRGG